MSLHRVLLVAAAVSFALAALELPVKVNLVAVGLFCWVLTELV